MFEAVFKGLSWLYWDFKHSVAYYEQEAINNKQEAQMDLNCDSTNSGRDKNI